MASILVADASHSNRLYLKLLLEMHGHHVYEASSAHTAMALFKQHRPQLTITEVALPDLPGAVLVSHIKSHSQEQFFPVFIITSEVSSTKVQELLKAGADDFLQKPFLEDLFLAKVESLLRNLDFYNDLRHSKEIIADLHNNLAWEHQSAERIFDKFVYGPRKSVPGLDVHISSASIFNGDVFLSSITPAGNILSLLGDFTGHGLPAAIGAIPVAETFYTMLGNGRSAKEILREINDKLKNILPEHIFFGCLLLEVNPKKRKAAVCNAGMQPALMFDGITQKAQQFPSTSLPLGVLPFQQLQIELETFLIEGHEHFVLYTDGIVEAPNADKEMFGVERLIQALQASDLDLGYLVDQAQAFSTTVEFEDDVTLVKLDFGTMIAASPTLRAKVFAERLQKPSHWQMQFCFSADQLQQTQRPVETLVDAISGVQPLLPFKEDLFVVITELYMNALEHGLLQLDSNVKQAPNGFLTYAQQKAERLAQLAQGQIEVKITQVPIDALEADIDIWVCHNGQGQADKTVTELDTQSEIFSGRGIKLVKALCHQFEFHQGGRQVRAVYRWGGAQT